MPQMIKTATIKVKNDKNSRSLIVFSHVYEPTARCADRASRWVGLMQVPADLSFNLHQLKRCAHETPCLWLLPVWRGWQSFTHKAWCCPQSQRLLGKLNTVPSRTPADGQRWVMVLRLV